MNSVDARTTADQIVMLERGALDRWGKGDPGGFLTYNLVNYLRDAEGVESVGSRRNSTTVYQRRGHSWKAIHSHWSFTRHPAFEGMSAEASEGL